MNERLTAYSNILRALIDQAGGELVVEITNESEEPFTIAYRLEHDHSNKRLFVRITTDNLLSEKIQ